MLQYQAFLIDHLKFQSFKEKIIFVTTSDNTNIEDKMIMNCSKDF